MDFSCIEGKDLRISDIASNVSRYEGFLVVAMLGEVAICCIDAGLGLAGIRLRSSS